MNYRAKKPEIILGQLLLLLLLLSCRSSGQLLAPSPTPWPTPERVEKPLYRVERTTLRDAFTVEGEVVPKVYQPLSFRLAGSIGLINVVEGDEVQGGDILAELAMDDLRGQMEAAQSRLTSAQDALWQFETRRDFERQRAQLKLDLAQARLEQAKQSGSEADITVFELEAELAQLDLAEVEAMIDPALERAVAQTQAEVEGLTAQVEPRRLRAPFAGRIVTAEVGAGHTRGSLDPPQPGQAVRAQQPVFVIAQPGPLQIIIRAGQERVTELTAGQTVTIRHPWAADQPFQAQISRIEPVDPGPQSSQTPAIFIDLPGQHLDMAVGNRLEIEIEAAVFPNALILPPDGVREFAGRTFVVVQENDRQRRIDVKLGLRDESFVQILAGLTEGQEVVGQ